MYPGLQKCTKLTKPPVAILRLQGCAFAIYRDAIITVDDVFQSYLTTTIKTINLFQTVGFMIHSTKSNFIASKKVEYLALILIRENDNISLRSEKEKDTRYSRVNSKKARFEK